MTDTVPDSSVPTSPENERAQVGQVVPFRDLNDRLIGELIIRDTKRTDFYLDAKKALEYGLIDGIVEG